MPNPHQSQKVLCSLLLPALAYQCPTILAGQNDSNAFENYKKLSLETADNDSKIRALWDAAQEHEDNPVTQHSIDQANANFSYLGLPINPLLVKEFYPWHSDPKPSIMSIDIGASQFANRYDSSAPAFDKYDFVDTNDHSDNSTFRYKWLGKLSNGIHALKTVDNTAGSAVFFGLLFVKFELNEMRVPTDHTQLLMINKGFQHIGDRVQSKITMQSKDNKVILETTEWNGTEQAPKKETLDLN